jgi:hypothetical protein
MPSYTPHPPKRTRDIECPECEGHYRWSGSGPRIASQVFVPRAHDCPCSTCNGRGWLDRQRLHEIAAAYAEKGREWLAQIERIGEDMTRHENQLMHKIAAVLRDGPASGRAIHKVVGGSFTSLFEALNAHPECFAHSGVKGPRSLYTLIAEPPEIVTIARRRDSRSRVVLAEQPV